jgi:hypothetical protein
MELTTDVFIFVVLPVEGQTVGSIESTLRMSSIFPGARQTVFAAKSKVIPTKLCRVAVSFGHLLVERDAHEVGDSDEVTPPFIHKSCILRETQHVVDVSDSRDRRRAILCGPERQAFDHLHHLTAEIHAEDHTRDSVERAVSVHQANVSVRGKFDLPEAAGEVKPNCVLPLRGLGDGTRQGSST